MISDYGTLNDYSPHILADFLEIKCLLENRVVSRGDLETIIELDGGHGLKAELGVGEKSETGKTSAENNDRIQRLSEDVFLHLSYRASAFDTWYPFKVDADVIEGPSGLSKRQKVYTLLLTCSRLKMLPPSSRNLFAARFEELSVEAVKGVFPGWEVLHFGVGGRDRKQFGTKFKDAITNLAAKLKDATTASVSKISNHHTGDGGIDIVALNTMDDDAQGRPCYLVQCAARANAWPEKKLEAHSIIAGQWIQFFHDPGTIITAPIFYREPNGNWIDESAFRAILLDRLRLIKMIDQQEGGLNGAHAAVPDELSKIFKTAKKKHSPKRKTRKKPFKKLKR